MQYHARLSIVDLSDRANQPFQSSDKRYSLLYNGEIVGKITSGTQSPTLNSGIGLGYVQKHYSKIGTELHMLVRGKKLKCKIVKSPFYSKGSLKN